MAIRLSLFWLLFLSFQAQCQVAERPVYKVGDTWRIERFDLAKKETGSREWRVTEISADAVKLQFKHVASNAVMTLVTDLEGNTLEGGGRKYDPKYMWYSFPLFVGKKWTNKFSTPMLQGAGTSTEERVCEVLALEEVVTKAGAFKAYKIGCQGSFILTHGFNRPPMAGQSFSTHWYSPEVKRMVKLEFKNTQPRGGWFEQYVDEVVSFELQK